MNWRPKGWKTPVAIKGDWDNAPNSKKWDIPHSHGWRDGFEAGADAILEALRGKGYPIKVGESFGDETGARTIVKVDGHVVFIPDDGN